MKKGTKLSLNTRKKMSLAKKGKMPKNYALFRAAQLKYKMPDSEKKRKSEDYKARGIRPPSRKGIPSWNSGKTNIYSQETRDSISKTLKKHFENNPFVLTMESRIKIGKAHSGDKCTFWKGGLAKINLSERQNFMATLAYKEWRRAIFERDGYTCQACGEKGGKLRAHHIKKYRNYPELRIILTNGITICYDCDNKLIVHREEKWESFFYFSLMIRGFVPPTEMIYLPEL